MQRPRVSTLSRSGSLWLAVAATLLALGLFEIGLRFYPYAPVEFHRPDPVYGTALIPGAEGWWTREGRTFVRVNADGMRDRAHEAAKPPGTLRVAVLGDSYAEAFQVPQEQTFWSRLERELAACPALAGRPVEVLNFGVGGFGTAESLLSLRQRVWRYDPDVVLLAFTTGNDVRNNSRALQGTKGRPYFVYDGGRLVLDDRFAQARQFQRGALRRGFDALLQGSRVVSLWREARRRLRERSELGARPAQAVALREVGLDDQIYRPPQSAEWEEAWRVSEALVRQLHEETASRGARFLLVTLSNAFQVHPDADFRRRYARMLGVDDLFYPEERLGRAASGAGIDHLALAPALRAVAEAEGECVHGFPASPCIGHWNERGHRAAGQRIAARLCSAEVGRSARR